MLSKVIRPRIFQRQLVAGAMKRQFSSQVALVQEEVENHHLNNSRKLGPKGVSDHVLGKAQAEAAQNKEYHEMLKDVDARQKFFQAITH